MDAAAVALIALAVFAWGLLSARFARADLSAPIVFVAVGYVLSEVTHVIEPELSHEVVKVVAEVTLVWVLFADAARVRLSDLRADLGLYTRLLAVGLPLTMIAGTLLALGLFDGMGAWMALLVGAALAPTDAALGAAVMTNPAVLLGAVSGARQSSPGLKVVQDSIHSTMPAVGFPVPFTLATIVFTFYGYLVMVFWPIR